MFGVILARIQTPNRYCIAVVSLFDPLINYPPQNKPYNILWDATTKFTSLQLS
jgi:hypothetical protein